MSIPRPSEFGPVRRTNVADTIAEQIAQRIITGSWQPGDALPSLRKLAAELRVSPLTVREALRTLQAMGFVETRHGSGTYVRSPDPDDAHAPWLMLSRDVDEYEELIEARQLIEAQILRLAAKRRTEKDLARLTEIVGRMTEARCEAYAFLAADLEFHIALADASHNRVLNRAMQAIRGPLTRVQANRAIADVERDGNLDRPIADHREIVEALAQGSDRTGPLERIVGRAEAMLDQLRAQQPQGEPPAAWCLSDSQARPQAL